MPKKRKTRKQKEQRQARPRANTIPKPQPTRSTERVPKQEKSPVAAVSSSSKSEAGHEQQHAERLRIMKFSLLVFTALAAFQLVIWLLIQLQWVPDVWMEILTG